MSHQTTPSSSVRSGIDDKARDQSRHPHQGAFSMDNKTMFVDDPKRTARIMRKIDLRILPIASLLYLFSFLDRAAIGNARVAGMYTDLKLTYGQYAASVSIFFALYCLLEVPSNLMLKRFGAKRWLPFIVVLWGIMMALCGLVKNFGGLFAMRMLLGACESGLFPGVTYLLTSLYPRRYIQLRIGIFFSAATLAGAFGGLLAYALTKVQTGSYSGWSWIFFVEGMLTIVAGIISYFVLFSSLDDAPFLSEDERAYMQHRVLHDATDIAMDDSFDWKYVRAGLLDWKAWLSITIFTTLTIPLYSVSLTLPTILKATLHYDAVDTQLMTIPIYVVAAMLVVSFSFMSDRMQFRSGFLIGGSILSAVGWSIGYAYPTRGWVRYGAMFISTFSYAAFPSVVALLTQNVGGKTKRSVVIGIQIGVGGLSGIVAGNIFPNKWAPHFQTSYLLNICFASVAAVFAAVNWYCLTRANARKARMIESGEAASLTHEQLASMGDASPYFVYKY